MTSKKQLRTAIVTWISYCNFGTYLQAYALQTVIRTLGCENYIISDKRFVRKLSWKSVLIKTFYYAFCCLKGEIIYLKGRKISIENFEKFERKYLLIDKTWETYSDLDNRYDLYVCGSDQIWTPILPMNDYYYCGFTDKKKIAYAPSVGQKYYPEERKKLVKPLLERFSHLSVREEKGKELLQKFINKPIEVVLDPTLLLPSEEWHSLLNSKPNHSKEYVLCYFLTHNETYWQKVKDFAEEKHLPIKLFIVNKKDLGLADESLFVGPLEFLHEIRDASYFFTDSFHGSIFAIHFEKRFLTFKRFKEDADNNQNSRVENLFSLLGISEYFVDEDDFEEKLNLPFINYSQVKERLKERREYSVQYLKYALEK